MKPKKRKNISTILQNLRNELGEDIVIATVVADKKGTHITQINTYEQTQDTDESLLSKTLREPKESPANYVG